MLLLVPLKGHAARTPSLTEERIAGELSQLTMELAAGRRPGLVEMPSLTAKGLSLFPPLGWRLERIEIVPNILLNTSPIANGDDLPERCRDGLDDMTELGTP
ncbi:hypothetical protein VTJ04DRAFT_2412 [Mycothermus thermophilus]|uniref:uncharacterized protein n=1 Tax=Humicola insolens TaxID=85995 RepID=UPI0037440ED9